MKAFLIAADLLREAASRKWFLALAIGITGVLLVVGLSLRMDVVDGALAATRLFGKLVSSEIRSADVALRPVFQAAAYLVSYGGIAFFIVACADFAPSLLAPGRIEHLLALPVRRWELVIGTFLGVFVLGTLSALYGAGGLALILGIKTGVWTFRPVVAGLLASGCFVAIYAAMLATAVVVRSAAVSAAVGAGLFVGGIVAGNRATLIPLFEPGVGRTIFKGLTLALPRVSAVARAAADIAGSVKLDTLHLASVLGGTVVFGLSALALAVWLFERKDF